MVVRIAATGGPCGGKTTVLNATGKEFNEKVVIVPESATLLMGGGFPAPSRDLPNSTRRQYLFQGVVTPLQINIEETFIMVAEQMGAQVIVSDRGLMDGAAYDPDGREGFLQKIGLTAQECFDRYDLVLHLESVATCNPSLYGKAGNTTRYESLDEAIALEYRIREVWQGHPNWKFISGEGGIDQVVAQVISIISEYVDVEIERKFWMTNLDINKSLMPTPDRIATILQGYLAATNDGELRIRKLDNEHFLSSKGSGTLRRAEWERLIPQGVFNRMLSAVVGNLIRKDRYYIPYGAHTLEMDVYHDNLNGMITLECEFSSEDEAAAFVLPDWAAGAVEVTDDPGFKNKSLALNGPPKNLA